MLEQQSPIFAMGGVGTSLRLVNFLNEQIDSYGEISESEYEPD